MEQPDWSWIEREIECVFFANEVEERVALEGFLYRARMVHAPRLRAARDQLDAATRSAASAMRAFAEAVAEAEANDDGSWLN